MTTRKSKSDKPPRRTRASSTLRFEKLYKEHCEKKYKEYLESRALLSGGIAAPTDLQSKLEELTRSDPQKAEQDRIAHERLLAKLEELTRSDPQKAEQDRIAHERLLAELEERTPPDRRRSTLELASDVLENPGEWLRTSNTQLGNRRPIDLMGTDEEEKVFDLLHAVDQGLF